MSLEIDNKIIEIVEYIKTSDSYKNYLKAKDILDKDIEINKLIAEIKILQKELVKNKSKEKELELDNKLNILNSKVIYTEYLNYLDEVNNMLNIFENKINKYFFDLFN